MLRVGQVLSILGAIVLGLPPLYVATAAFIVDGLSFVTTAEVFGYSANTTGGLFLSSALALILFQIGAMVVVFMGWIFFHLGDKVLDRKIAAAYNR